MIKALAKRFAAAIPAMLKCSRSLRFYHAEHVRSMAAQAFAFPLRHASDKHLRRAVIAVFAGALLVMTDLGLYCCAQYGQLASAGSHLSVN